MKNDVKKYIKQIKKEFPYINKSEKIFLKQLRKHILSNEYENDYKQLIESYGSPNDIVYSYIQDNEHYVYSKQNKLRKLALLSFICLCIILISLTTAYFIESRKSFINREIIEISYDD